MSDPSKRTPGTWIADVKDHDKYLLDGDCIEVTVHDEDGFVETQVCSVLVDTSGDTHAEIMAGVERAEADANLMAAAPEMHEALCLLVRRFGRLRTDENDHLRDHACAECVDDPIPAALQGFRCSYHLALLAMAKAEGK